MQPTQEKQKKSAPPVQAGNANNNLPTTHQSFVDEGWDEEVIDTKDILIPKCLLMHPTSELVKKGTRSIGEIIKSTSEDVIAKRGETFDVVVFEKWKEWRIMKKNAKSGRFEYVRTEPWSAANDAAAWDYTENGEEYRRDKTMNFYGILQKDAKEGQAFPIKLSFVRTSFKIGHKIADAWTRALSAKIPPHHQFFKIGAELKEGKEESFFAFTVAAGGDSTPEARASAGAWRKTVMEAKKTNSIVDHEVDEEVSTSHAVNTTEF